MHVETALERILASRSFRSSQRCSAFLRFVVTHALNGQQEHLKERTIATEVFGRAATYDPGEDAIVRVKANEVRKRLAQYYQENAAVEGSVRIDLPTGTYVPRFVFPEPAELSVYVDVLRERRQAPLWSRAALAVVLVGVLVAGFSLLRPAARTPYLKEFWGPALEARSPVLLCPFGSNLYWPDPATREALSSRLPGNPPRGRYSIPIEPGDRFQGPFSYWVDSYVHLGDVVAAVNIGGVLSELGKASQVRTGQEISFGELRKSPAVLIGAFNNRWSLQAMRDLRFTFEDYTYIQDHSTGKQYRTTRDANGHAVEDYAVVTRIRDRASGQFLVIVAGLLHFGTQAAGEFVTSEEHLSHALREASSDWKQGEFQALLRMKVVSETPGRPALVILDPKPHRTSR
ncbi:MAG TPA: hypothetical protein DEH78_04760 [Solibacterales bacterium]|nr:hypothetical protein [Bryobacterales bacterium]